jgi:hypothetical protein
MAERLPSPLLNCFLIRGPDPLFSSYTHVRVLTCSADGHVVIVVIIVGERQRAR